MISDNTIFLYRLTAAASKCYKCLLVFGKWFLMFINVITIDNIIDMAKYIFIHDH